MRASCDTPTTLSCSLGGWGHESFGGSSSRSTLLGSCSTRKRRTRSDSGKTERPSTSLASRSVSIGTFAAGIGGISTSSRARRLSSESPNACGNRTRAATSAHRTTPTKRETWGLTEQQTCPLLDRFAVLLLHLLERVHGPLGPCSVGLRIEIGREIRPRLLIFLQVVEEEAPLSTEVGMARDERDERVPLGERL